VARLRRHHCPTNGDGRAQWQDEYRQAGNSRVHGSALDITRTTRVLFTCMQRRWARSLSETWSLSVNVVETLQRLFPVYPSVDHRQRRQRLVFRQDRLPLCRSSRFNTALCSPLRGCCYFCFWSSTHRRRSRAYAPAPMWSHLQSSACFGATVDRIPTKRPTFFPASDSGTVYLGPAGDRSRCQNTELFCSAGIDPKGI